MQRNTYLSFNGNFAEAFKHYEKALGGKIVMMMTHMPLAQTFGDVSGPLRYSLDDQLRVK